MNIEEEIKDSADYKAIEKCLHYVEGHGELEDLRWQLELAQDVMLSPSSLWYYEFIEDLDTTNPEEFVPRRE